MTPEVTGPEEQVRNLRQRLNEAEETLRALRSGEVDAVVAPGPDGDRVYTLRGADEAYRAMVLNMAEGALTVAPDGLILFSNEQFAVLAGVPLERVIGFRLPDFVTDEDLPAIRLLLSGSGRASTEIRLKRSDATLVQTRVSAKPLLVGDARCLCMVVADLTEQKQFEARLIGERQRAEEANRCKSEFLAAMSHEIRTPMNAILGMADLLWETELDQNQKEYVGRFRRAGASLMSLINDILDLSKIESGRFELESVDFSLSDLLARTVELMTPRARMKNIDLVANVARGTPQFFVGDPGRIQQILNNIIGNAIKFTETGCVALDVSEHPDKTRGHLCFSVSDTGIGISADKLEVIFDDFTQAESSTTRRFGGTGLGLGICRRLVNRMGGTLKVESELGKGSTFQFDVVLSVGETRNVNEATEAVDMLGLRVLVVDGDATSRMIVARTCASWGMVVAEAVSGEQACSLTRVARSRDPFAVALLDDAMLGAQGLDVVGQLLQIDPALPVIVTSSNEKPGDKANAKSLGAAGYASKPMRRTDLLTLVHEALRQTGESRESRFAIVPGAAKRRSKPKTMRILVAEDSQDNRFLVSAYLKNRPYELTFVENGAEALDMFASREFDLVLMDIHMPVMDGLAAAESIRALERERSTRAVPIVALTAHARAEDAERSRAAGCNAHVSKPISRDRLVAAIESFRSSSGIHGAAAEAPRGAGRGLAIEIPEGFEELSTGYMAARRKEISQLMAAPPRQNWDEIKSFGHNMKGTGTSFGFPELTKLGAAIEEAAKAANTVQVTAYLSEARDYVEYASRALS